MNAIAQIVEMDQERDRKTCLSLYLKVTGANRELAQWLVDHPRYSGAEVARWLGCGETRILNLRRWANRGFDGAPHYDEKRRRRENNNPRLGADGPLETNDNSESDAVEHDDEGGVVTESETEVKVAEPKRTDDNSYSVRQRVTEDPDDPDDIPIKWVKAAEATGRRRVFLRCIEDSVRKAEQGAGLKGAGKAEIDDEVLAALESVIKAWVSLRDEILTRNGE